MSEEIEKIEYPKKRYECSTCGSFINVNRKIPENQVKCACKNPSLVLLSTDIAPEDFAQIESCHQEIIKVLRYYLDVPEDILKVISIWIIGTYTHQEFQSYPYIFFNASKGSGKTRLLKLISSLSYGSNGNVQTGISEAVFFRTPKGHTLIIDECESISNKEKALLREYMNASYKKGVIVQRMKKVRRKDAESYEIEQFEPYKPLALANIKGLDDILGDRCLTFILEKSNNPLITKKIEDFDTNPTIKNIKSILNELKCSLCSVVAEKNNITKWNTYISKKYNDYTYIHTYNTYNTIPTLTTYDDIDETTKLFFDKIDSINIQGRDFELVFPLLIISYCLNGEIFEELLKIVKNIVEMKMDQQYLEDKDVSLIDFIATLQSQSGIFNLDLSEHIAIKRLTYLFRNYLGETDDKKSQWINERWMGRALRRMSLITNIRRVAQGIEVILNTQNAKKQIGIFNVKNR